jgi:hypothetical protein
MTSIKTVAAALCVFAGLGLSSAAVADAAATNRDCVLKAKEYSDAVKAVPDSAVTGEVRMTVKNARTYCSVNMYDKGVALYQHAIDLLQAQK